MRQSIPAAPEYAFNALIYLISQMEGKEFAYTHEAHDTIPDNTRLYIEGEFENPEDDEPTTIYFSFTQPKDATDA